MLLIILLPTCLLFYRNFHKRKLQLANPEKASTLDIDNLSVNLQDNPSYFTTAKSCNEANHHEYDDTVNSTDYSQASLINIENAMKLNCINSAYNGSTVSL